MATDVFKLLTSLGLPKIEAKVYLANLKLGPTSVQNIAKEAGLSRTAAYQAIEELQGRGLVSTFRKGKKTLYAAEDPEGAVALFKTSMKKMEEQLGLFQKMMPELKALSSGERPSVRFYEGNEALYAVFNDAASVNPATMDEVTNLDDVYGFLDIDTLRDARKVFLSKKSQLRILHRGEIRNSTPGVKFCELAPELGEFHGDIMIYGNRVVFVAFIGKIMSVIIESQPFADTARVLFEAAWRMSKK